MIYLFTFAISFILLSLGYHTENPMKRNIIYFIAILPPAIIAGCRDLTIGTDTDMYPYSTYLTCKHSHTIERAFRYTISGMEELYVLLAYFSAHLFPHPNFFLFITHLIILVTLLYSFKKAGINLAVAFALFYLMFYANSLNAARQFLAMPFCLLSLIEFIRRKYFLCVLSMCLAFGFHHSSLFFLTILLLYYLCSRHRKLMKKRSTMVIIVMSIVLGIYLFNEILTSFVGIGLTDIKYLERYGSGDRYGTNVPISLFSINIFNLLMFTVVSRKIREKAFVVFSRYVLIISFLLCFMGLISTFAVRLGAYYMIVSIVSMVYIMRRNGQQFSTIVYSFYMFYWLMTVVVARIADTYPYHSKILSSIV